MSALGWLPQAASDRVDAGVHRVLRPRPAREDLLNFSGNDYLGMSRRAEVVAAAVNAAQEFGAGATASRLVSGTTELHERTERALADFMGFPAALVFSSGYMANCGAIAGLLGRDDLIVSDAGSHASLIDGCRLSRAHVVVTERGRVDQIERALAEHAPAARRVAVVTDTVYSIDGAVAPVAQIYQTARRHGAFVIADEAHALGVCGPGGRGVVADAGLAGAPDLVATTVLSKSLGAQGGVVLGSAEVRDHLIDCARTFIFDTGLAPAALGAATAALELLREQPELADRVRSVTARIAAELRERGCAATESDAAVVSIVVGDPNRAVAAADHCRAHGVLVGCFRPPSVPVGTSRLRLTANAGMSDDDVDRAVAAVVAALEAVR